LSSLILVDAGAPLPWKTPEEQPAWLTASINRLGKPSLSYQDYLQALKAAPFIGPYWNEYFDLYYQNDIRPEGNGLVAARAYREGIIEEGLHYHEALPEEQWANVQVPTLLLRAGQGLFSDNDHLLTEEAAKNIVQGIANCRYVNFPTLNHYTIVFGVEAGPVKEIQKFLRENDQ
jgi:hypothetical protein